MKEENKPIVVAGHYIKLGVKCPKCNKWNKTVITVIKSKCTFCNDDFEKDISIEEKESYDSEIAKDYLFMLMKDMMTRDEVTFSVRDNHMPKIRLIEAILKNKGYEVEITPKDIFDETKKKKILTNQVTFRKSEEFIFHIEKKKMPIFR